MMQFFSYYVISLLLILWAECVCVCMCDKYSRCLECCWWYK